MLPLATVPAHRFPAGCQVCFDGRQARGSAAVGLKRERLEQACPGMDVCLVFYGAQVRESAGQDACACRQYTLSALSAPSKPQLYARRNEAAARPPSPLPTCVHPQRRSQLEELRTRQAALPACPCRRRRCSGPQRGAAAQLRRLRIRRLRHPPDTLRRARTGMVLRLLQLCMMCCRCGDHLLLSITVEPCALASRGRTPACNSQPALPEAVLRGCPNQTAAPTACSDLIPSPSCWAAAPCSS